MERSASGCFVLIQDHADAVRASRDTCFVRINPIKYSRCILTVDIVINKPLARVELASRFSVN